MRGKYENARYRLVAQELEDRIRTGEIRQGEMFLTREEIASRYDISPLTAFRVIKYLEETGYLNCGRGRRSRVIRGIESCGRRDIRHKKIGLLIPADHPGTPCPGWEWLQYFLLNRLRYDGQTSFRMEYHEGDELPAECDGFLVLHEREYAPCLYQLLRESGKPFCMISLYHPAENTAYLMPLLALNQLTLYLVRRQVRHLLIFSGAELPLERFLQQSRGDLLPYDIPLTVEFQSFTIRDPDETLRLRTCLLQNLSAGDCGFFSTNRQICDLLREEMRHFSRVMRKNFIHVGISKVILNEQKFISAGNLPFPVLNMDLPVFAEKFIAMLYRQFETGHPEPGMIHPFSFEVNPVPGLEKTISEHTL